MATAAAPAPEGGVTGLILASNGRDRLALARDDEGKRVVKIVKGPRRSTHRGELIRDYEEDLQSPRVRVETFRQMRNTGEVHAGLSRLKTPVEQADDEIVPARPLPKLPSELAAEAELEEPVAEDLEQLDTDTKAAWHASSNLWGWPFAEYQMRTPWDKFKREALSCVDFGAAFFERRDGWRDGRLGMRLGTEDLWLIEPETIEEIAVDREGELMFVSQRWSFTYHDDEGKRRTENQQVEIPAEHLVPFVFLQEGAEWGGRALLRILHGAWKRHGWMTRVRVIDCVRRGAPPPIVDIQEDGADLSRIDELEDLCMRIATGDLPEQAWGVLTPGVKLGYMEAGSNRPDLEKPIGSEEETMRAIFGTESFTEGGGSLARAKEQTPYFNLTLLALSRLFIGVVQKFLINRMTRLNWLGAGMPELRQPGVVPRDLETLKEFAKSKSILMTGDVMQTIHEELDLPQLTPEQVADLNETPLNLRQTVKPGAKPGEDDEEEDEDLEDGEGDGEDEVEEEEVEEKDRQLRSLYTPARDHGFNGKNSGPIIRAGVEGNDEEGDGGFLARKTWRDPTEHERRFVDLASIEQDYQRHERDWTAAVLEVRNALIDKAAAALDVDGVRVKQPRPVREKKKLTATMLGLSEKMRELGKMRAANEIERQVQAWKRGELEASRPAPKPKTRAGGIEIGIDSVVDRVEGELLSALETDVAAVLNWVNTAVRDETLEVLLDPAFTGTDDEAKTEGAARAKEQGKPALDAMGRDQGSRAYNGGRVESMAILRDDLPDGVALDFVVRSELIDDPSVCDPCVEEDRDSRESPIDVESSEFWARKPPQKCKGRGRCRGQYLPVLVADEDAA